MKQIKVDILIKLNTFKLKFIKFVNKLHNYW